MPSPTLIDLQTDLTSFRYGHDLPGGGDSGQPFIVNNFGNVSFSADPKKVLRLIRLNNVSIPNIGFELNRSEIGRAINKTLDDNFIRGGGVGAVQASLNDLFRIGSFLATAPKGPLFIAKQVGLQLTNPKLEVKRGGIGSFISATLNPGRTLGTLTGGLLGPTRVYNLGINTLAQVPVNAFGIHFNRHGLLPLQSEDTKYESVVTFNNNSDNSKFNRLVGYKNKFELGDREFEITTDRATARRQNIQVNRAGRREVRILRRDQRKLSRPPKSANKELLPPFPPKIKYQGWKRIGLDISSLLIDRYITGPDSVYGVGATTLKRYSFTEDKIKTEESLDNSYTFAGRSRLLNDVTSVDYSKAVGSNNIFSRITRNVAISDYGIVDPVNASITNLPPGANAAINSFFPTQINTTIGATYDSASINAATNQGLVTDYLQLVNLIAETTQIIQNGYSSSVFTVNPQIDRGTPDFRYYGSSSLSESGSKKTYNNTGVFSRNDDDIFSIVFTAIDPYVKNLPTETAWVFSGYISNYRDSFNASWNETNYVGRAESFYIYNRFKRGVSFNLKIPCFNKVQLFEKHKALGQLASVTAGSYNSNTVSGVLLKVNIGNYLRGEYAVLNSIDYSIPDGISWDISTDALLAMYIEANINLTIIHKNLPQYFDPAENPDSGFFSYLSPGTHATGSSTIRTKFQID